MRKCFARDDKKNRAVMAAVYRTGEEKWHTSPEHGISKKVGSSIAFQ